MRIATFLLATALAAVPAALAQQGEADFVERQPTPVLQALQPRQTQGTGTPLYLDEPSCGYYQCNVTYHPGDTATAHWLDAPSGNVVLDMIGHPGDAIAHHVATVPGTTTNCDAEGQKTCGQFRWIVPTDWAPGNYTLQATSESDPSVQSYTDIILVQVNPNNSTNVPFTALDPVASNSTSSSSSSSASSSSSNAAATTSGTGSGAGAGTQSSAASAPASSASSGSTSGAGALHPSGPQNVGAKTMAIAMTLSIVAFLAM